MAVADDNSQKPTIEYSKVESQFDSDESSSEDSRPKQKRRKRIEVRALAIVGLVNHLS
jgi:hypothetical protein